MRLRLSLFATAIALMATHHEALAVKIITEDYPISEEGEDMGNLA